MGSSVGLEISLFCERRGKFLISHFGDLVSIQRPLLEVIGVPFALASSRAIGPLDHFSLEVSQFLRNHDSGFLFFGELDHSPWIEMVQFLRENNSFNE